MIHAFLFPLAVLATLSLCSLTPPGEALAAENGLFAPAAEAERTIPAKDSAGLVLRERLVHINFDLLTDGPQRGEQDQAPRPVTLNLFPGLDLPMNHVRTEFPTPDGTRVWIGQIVNQPGSQITIAVTNGVAAGNIRTQLGDLFQIRYAGGDVYALRQIDTGAFPPEAEPRVAPDARPNAIPDAAPGSGDSSQAPAQPDDGSIIDVMIVYTPAAVTAVGGLSAMQSLVATAVTETNTGYGNSGLVQRIRLVYQSQVEYTESQGFEGALDDVTNGNVPNVHTWRDQYGADMVSFWIDDYQYCGLAWLMTQSSGDFANRAFSVVSHRCATGYYSFAHEMGHNQGCHHDRANASGEGYYPYSYGYQHTTAPLFRTIMAYACSGVNCPRLNYWSNPDVSYQGAAMGVSSSASNSADNRLSMNNTRTIAANWRQAVNTGSSHLFWRNIADGRNKVWHYSGSSVSSTTDYRTVNTVWQMCGTGDFNGDGQTDVVWRNTATGENALWLLNNGTPTTVLTRTVEDQTWQIQATGDFNGDSRTDLMWRNTSTGKNRVWYMDGANATAVAFTDLPDTNWAFAGSGDFNSDGQPDLILRNYATGENAIWYLNGITITSASGFEQVGSTAWRIVAATDFNGDNFPDIFWRNMGNGNGSVWVMNSSLGPSPTSLTQVPNLNWTIGGAGAF